MIKRGRGSLQFRLCLINELDGLKPIRTESFNYSIPGDHGRLLIRDNYAEGSKPT
jgi:hypothetical protein